MDERHLEMAEQFQEEQLARAIEKARKTSELEGGVCLNCSEKLLNNKKFCDEWCREDYEVRERVHRKTHAC